MGIDCFGRGTYGGGRLNCDVAVAAARNAGAQGSASTQSGTGQAACSPPACALTSAPRPVRKLCGVHHATTAGLYCVEATSGCYLLLLSACRDVQVHVTGLSVALFAPGWVYEGGGGCHDWRQVDEQLWSSLAAVLGAGRALARRLPFGTTFDVGAGCATWHKAGPPALPLLHAGPCRYSSSHCGMACGCKLPQARSSSRRSPEEVEEVRYGRSGDGTEQRCLWGLQGEEASSRPWFNLSRQALQPLFQRCARVQLQLTPCDVGGGAAVSLSTLEARVSQDAAYEGGSSLRLHGVELPSTAQHACACRR